MSYLRSRLSAAMWSRVLVLWLILALAGLVGGGGAVLFGRSIQDNIRGELATQQIRFGAAEQLSEEERAIPGLLDNAGQQVTTGNQAQIYSLLIALHMQESAIEAGYPDASYATLGGVQRQLRAEVAAATEAGDEEAIAAAQESLTTVSNLRTSMQTGSTLRGNLLSAYGWDNVASGVIAAGVFIMVLGIVFLLLFVYEWRLGHLPQADASTTRS
ncbi:MAG: hypothetical protein KME04_12170 [Pleurocapsa minor GSE-CHR-MK-17-07R]|jgi:hypothetical protein|nr:hypothetical protein [Pleurocapsa minor GSE-CHR-MK 17-07R]